MPRSPSSADAFSAIAERRRRALIDVLAASGECDVSSLVTTLGWPQPQVSKHLGVLRRVGLVRVTRVGRQRLYTLNAEELRRVYDWVRPFERLWTAQLDRIRERAERLHRERERSSPPPSSST